MKLNKPFEINVYVISIDPFEITYTLISKGLLNVIEIGGLDESVEFFVMHFKTVKQKRDEVGTLSLFWLHWFDLILGVGVRVRGWEHSKNENIYYFLV